MMWLLSLCAIFLLACPACTAYCKKDGKFYSDGASFVSKCKERCTCRGGGYSCSPLCGLQNLSCPRGQTVKVFRYRIRGYPACSCPLKKCVRSRDCVKDGKVYRHGASFVSKCKEICKCSNGGYSCSPLCGTQYLRCPRGQTVKVFRQRISGYPACSCPLKKCVRNRDCVKDGKVYRHGASFVPKCKEICKCSNGGYSCSPLCGPQYLRCPRGQTAKVFRRRISGYPACSCLLKKCVRG